MKQSVENRLERLERADDAFPWSKVERWIIHRCTARNLDTGETLPADELEPRRSKPGRLLITIPIVESDGNGRPKEATP